ncbi:hypothetical protein C8Q77DRAFT_1056967 [Trametes polyzona]|nr:hypothetical protein C8Q77DRAFT_1056967 [Trametes polyzona]
MSKTTKQQKHKAKASTGTSKEARQAAAQQLQTSKKRSKAQTRISKSQVADMTMQINGEFAQVQSLYAKHRSSQPSQNASSVPESTVQDLANVMKGL